MNKYNIINSKRRFLITVGLFSVGAILPIVTSSGEDSSVVAEDKSAVCIKTGKHVTTLINIIKVEPRNVSELLDLLKEGTENLFSKQPGFISVSFHRNNEGNKVILYGQWNSPEYIKRFRENSKIMEYFKQVETLAQFESIICEEVSYVNHH